MYTNTLKIIFLFIQLFSFTIYASAQSTALIDAIKEEKYVEAYELISTDQDIHQVDKNGANALLWACFKGNLKLVKTLVKKEVDWYPKE